MDPKYSQVTWVDPRQDFKPSPSKGIGSFGREPIQEGEVVEIVGGVVMNDQEFTRFVGEHNTYNSIQIAESLHLVEKPEITKRRLGGSLNHSCDSNLWLADEVTLVARRDIRAGEELTVDYALFTTDPQWAMDYPCQCGAPDCRMTITGSDWQLKAVQNRYAGHFSPFINDRIEKL